MNLPFAIGQVMWMAKVYPSRVTLPCPVCAGQRAVVVELGTGERVGVPCEACGKGFNNPTGTIEEWDHDPGVERFVIASVDSMHNGRWFLQSESGARCEWDELCATEAEAMEKSVARCAEQHERNMQSRTHKRRNTKEAAWSIRYHREQIRDLEQRIAWHQSKIQAVPQRKSDDANRD